MSVYGVSYSKFKKVSTEVDLKFSVIKHNWRIPQVISHKSILNGLSHSIKVADDKASYDVVCNIWKNGSPKVVMQDLLSYNHDTVKFMPHEDEGNYLTSNGTDEADFYISIMKPFYVKSKPPMLEDRLFVRFESLGEIFMPTATQSFLVDGDGDYFIDGSGNKLIIKKGTEDR